jgi:hypothetical protein
MNKSLSKFAAAAVIYAGFAVYLYQPYFKNFYKLQYLIVVNVCLASLGCYVLSRRWVIGFAGSLFAGAIYGFGPFALGLAGYHPTVGLLTATVPWLFCPAAFVRAHFCKRKATQEAGTKAKWQWMAVPLSALPFLAILIFFQISARYRLFAIPTQAKLHLADLPGLLAPLVMISRSVIIVSFYHIPIASLIMGFSMFLAARRFGPMYIFCLGTILAFCDSLFNISPIIWLSLPILCCSVLVGVGMQGLASAGFVDRKWVLASSVIMGVLAIVTLLPATESFQIFAGLEGKYAGLLTETAKMYILGAVAVTIIFFITRARLRVRWLRWVILCSAMAIDIFLGARFIVDRIF